MSFQECPICNGVGIVSGGYYNRAGDYEEWWSSHTTEICRTCAGKGIIHTVTGLPPSDLKADVDIEVRELK